MIDNVADKMIEIVDDIHNNNYFEDLFDKCLDKLNMREAAIYNKHYTNQQLRTLCQTFWFALPDASHIRRAPFWDICDVAEMIFDSDYTEGME